MSYCAAVTLIIFWMESEIARCPKNDGLV